MEGLDESGVALVVFYEESGVAFGEGRRWRRAPVSLDSSGVHDVRNVGLVFGEVGSVFLDT